MSLFDELRRSSRPAAGRSCSRSSPATDTGAKLLVREDGSTAGDGPASSPSSRRRAAPRPQPRHRARRAHRLRRRLGPPPRLLRLSARSTPPRRCAAPRSCSAGRRSSPTRAPASPRRERMPSADELLVALARRGARAGAARRRHRRRRPHPRRQVRPARCSTGALATDAFYVGALGSRRNQERRRGLLLEAGVAEADLDRIAGPCGLDIGADIAGRDRALDARRDPRRARRPRRRAAAGRERRIHVEPPEAVSPSLRRYGVVEPLHAAARGRVREARRPSRRRSSSSPRTTARARSPAARRSINVMKARAASPDALVDLNGLDGAEGDRARRRRDADDRRDDDVHASSSPRPRRRRGRSSARSARRSPTSRCATAARSAATSARTTRRTTCRR